MEKNRFDQWIKEVVQEEAQKISVPNQKEVILRTIREEKGMRKFNGKRMVATVAVLCVLLTASVAAGGKIVTLRVGSSSAAGIKSYQKVEKMEEKVGIHAKTLKQFENGFSFESANVRNTKGMDEKNNVIDSYQDLVLDYSKGTKKVSLYLSHPTGEEETDKSHREEHRGITMASLTNHYKFVPAGYEMTEEEKEKVEKGELYISEGTQKVEETDYACVQWVENETEYLLTSMGDVPEKELVEMAKDLMDNGK